MAEKQDTNQKKKDESVRYDKRKLEFMEKVKSRLESEHKKSRWGYDALLTELRERNYNVNKGTLKKILNPLDHSSFDLWIIKGLCECYNIPIGELLSETLDTEPESIPEPVVETCSDIESHNKLKQILESYMGTFFCYSNSKNFGKNDIVEFQLELKENNGIIAILTYYGNVDRRTGKPIVRTYSCVPKMLGDNEAILLEFTKEGHSFFHFYINYKGFFSSSLYHRRGFYVSTATDNKHSGAPLINCFVLFDKQLSASDIQNYVPTLLALENTKFYISKDTYKHIMQLNSDLSVFLTKYSEYFVEEDWRFRVDEVSILDRIASVKPNEKAAYEFRLLTQIKSYADNCTQLAFNDELPYARFSEYILTKEKADENELTQ